MYIIIFDNNKWNHLPRWICKHTHATPFFKEWQTVSKLKTCHQECALKKLKIGSNVNQEENTEHSLHIWELKLNKWKCTLYLNMIGKLTLLMMVLFLRILTLILVSLNNDNRKYSLMSCLMEIISVTHHTNLDGRNSNKNLMTRSLSFQDNFCFSL